MGAWLKAQFEQFEITHKKKLSYKHERTKYHIKPEDIPQLKRQLERERKQANDENVDKNCEINEEELGDTTKLMKELEKKKLQK